MDLCSHTHFSCFINTPMHTEHAQYDYSWTAAAALCRSLQSFWTCKKTGSLVAILQCYYCRAIVAASQSSASDSLLPSKLHQPLDFNFPKRSHGQKTPVLRSFQPSWFSQWPFYIMMKPKTWYSATCAFLGSRKIK